MVIVAVAGLDTVIPAFAEMTIFSLSLHVARIQS